MRRAAFSIVGLAAVAVLGLGAWLYARDGGQDDDADPAADAEAVQRLDQDARISVVADALRASAPSGATAFVQVDVVEPIVGAIAPDQTVIVRAGLIDWVGPADEAPDLAGAAVIDGAGRFLSPGLTDMHVHTEHLAQHVLRLAAGVTSVRDMDGFPWLLRTRDAIEDGKMIGATTYVAGTIIADRPLMGYAVVVRSQEQARRAVRDQAACGYSFVKVHNRLATPLFDAVAEEAGRQSKDVVGHVPHGVSLHHAIQDAHMRTIEHLKGFLDDRTLEPSDEDYASALAGAEIWLTPTLYTRNEYAHGAEARRLADDPRQRFNPRGRREGWRDGVPQEGSNTAKTYERYVRAQSVVMQRLLPLHPRWLVGSDAAGYAFNVAGFAALDEMLLLHQAGLTNADVVRAATSEPAAAMRRPAEFGGVAPGMRADLVLLDADPLKDLRAYENNLGVMARGRWYSRDSIKTALADIARIYDEQVSKTVDSAAAPMIATAVEARVHAGYVFEDAALVAGARAFEHGGSAAAAQTLRSLISAPSSGVCAEDLPN